MIKNILKIYELCELKRSKLFIFVILMVFVTFLEVLSLSIIYPLVKVMMGGSNLEYINYVKEISIFKKYPLIFVLCIILMFLFILKNIVSYLIRVWLAKFSWITLVVLRKKVVKDYAKLEYESFLAKGVVYVNSAINEYTRIIIQGMEASIRLIGEMLIFFLIIGYLLFLNINVTIILLFFVFIIALTYYLLTFKKVVIQGKENQEGEKVLYSSSYYLFRGIKEIKILRKENYLIDKLINGAKKISNANIQNQKIKLLPKYLLEAFFIIFGCLFIIFSTKMNYDNSEIISLISVYAFAALRLLPSVSQIGICINDLNFAISPTKLVYADIYENNLNNYISINKEKNRDDGKFKLMNLEGVSFNYKNSEKKILQNLNLEVKKNDFIGIIGQSGVGKSTLIDMILGYLKPTNGKIHIKDQQNNLIRSDEIMSYVAQEPIVIQGSISENIRLSEKESPENDLKVKNAIKFADLESFVNTLDEGINTILGEGGINLSIGQKQRLALARCFYSQREIMILDEPSSALDQETQDNIFDNLNFLKGKKTIILITHNHSTLKYCEKIFIFDDKTLKPYILDEKIK